MIKTKYKALATNILTLHKALRIIFFIDPFLFILLVVAIVTSGVLPILAIRASAGLIDYMVAAQTLDMGVVVRYILWWGAFMLVADIINPFITFLQSNMGDKAVFEINKAIIGQANKIQGLAHFEDQDFHNDIQVILAEAYYRPINLVVTFVRLLRDCTLISAGILLIFSNISWMSLLPLVGIVVHAKVVSKMQAEVWKESFGRSPNSRKMNYISALAVDPAYAKELRLFPIGKYLYNEYIRLFCLVYASIFLLRRRQLLWPLLSCFISIAANLVVLFYIATQINSGTLMIGAIVLLLQTLTQLYHSVLSFGMQVGWTSGHLKFFKKYFEFLSKEEHVYTTKVAKRHKLTNPAELHIAFDRVSFTYPDGRVALQDISFEIQPKEKLAIVGANGSGKTSLIKLLCGFYPPTSGQIRINDISIDQYDIQALRKLIAPVFQDFGNYALSLKQNIVMGDDPASDAQPILQKVGLGFVDSLEKGLEQPLGKRFGGTDLSIGQWQRVAIARALYKNASMFILDEPTAALDPISESEVFDQFAKICQDKTTLFITHRLTSVEIADRILLLDNGKQVALDTHSQLLRSNVIYRKMFESQASKYLDLFKQV